MHLYSNPEFFFEHWRTSIRKEAMRRKSAVDNLHMVSSSDCVFQFLSSHFVTKGTLGITVFGTKRNCRDYLLLTSFNA